MNYQTIKSKTIVLILLASLNTTLILFTAEDPDETTSITTKDMVTITPAHNTPFSAILYVRDPSTKQYKALLASGRTLSKSDNPFTEQTPIYDLYYKLNPFKKEAIDLSTSKKDTNDFGKMDLTPNLYTGIETFQHTDIVAYNKDQQKLYQLLNINLPEKILTFQKEKLAGSATESSSDDETKKITKQGSSSKQSSLKKYSSSSRSEGKSSENTKNTTSKSSSRKQDTSNKSSASSISECELLNASTLIEDQEITENTITIIFEKDKQNPISTACIYKMSGDQKNVILLKKDGIKISDKTAILKDIIKAKNTDIYIKKEDLEEAIRQETNFASPEGTTISFFASKDCTGEALGTINLHGQALQIKNYLTINPNQATKIFIFNHLTNEEFIIKIVDLVLIKKNEETAKSRFQYTNNKYKSPDSTQTPVNSLHPLKTHIQTYPHSLDTILSSEQTSKLIGFMLRQLKIDMQFLNAVDIYIPSPDRDNHYESITVDDNKNQKAIADLNLGQNQINEISLTANNIIQDLNDEKIKTIIQTCANKKNKILVTIKGVPHTLITVGPEVSNKTNLGDEIDKKTTPEESHFSFKQRIFGVAAIAGIIVMVYKLKMIPDWIAQVLSSYFSTLSHKKLF